MPQLTWRSLSFSKTPSHGPHIVGARPDSTSGAPASSCARRVNTDARVQPGDRAGDGLVLERGQLLLADARTGSCGARPLGREGRHLRGDGPGPGARAARAIAGALCVARLRELVAARIAHRRRGILGLGRAAAARA